MRYGVIVVTPVSSEKDRTFVNLGDMIQTEAFLYMYEKMGVSRDEVVRIDLNDLKEYCGEYLILPININLSLNWIVDVFPMSERIIPVFIGLSFFSAQPFPQKLKDYFRMYEPIGCRDECTLQIMRENGIQAYLFGCITAVLPKRSEKIIGEKTFFVDVPFSFIEYIGRNSAQKLGKVEKISHICDDKKYFDYRNIEEETKVLFEKYRNEAKLIVTSRLHCMSPCMAMGIPVIPVTDNISPRMGWVDRYLKIYTPEVYNEIDWNGQKIDYEKTKEKMLSIAIHRVQETTYKYKDMVDLSYWYETRKKSQYGNYYLSVLENLPDNRKEKLEYILWGAGQIGMNAYKVISSNFPDSKLISVIDSYCTGEFFGVPIKKPDSLTCELKEYVFITTTSGEACAKELLTTIGKKEVEDYLSMATTAG